MSLSLSPAEVHLLEPRFKALREAPIVDSDLPGAPTVGWLSTAFTENGVPLGGGCAQSRTSARKIALAETLERAAFHKLKVSSEAESQFRLLSFASTCGFAAGFEPQQTRFRSVCEAVERWARAKWIDEGGKVSQM